MSGLTDKNREQILDEALQQFVNSQLHGQEIDIEELVKQYPELEHQIKERIKKFKKINNIFDSLSQADENEFDDAPLEYDLVGQRIASFEIEEMVGRGGMGVVYRAHDTRLKRSVAVKSMPVKLKANPTAQMRFRREAELLASLNHPNIAVIHEIVEEGESGYLILEYVPGETLAERIAHGPLELEEVLSISRQIAKAVSAAHKKDIIHRDLKPGNIKITPDCQVKVLDFGLAKELVSESRNYDTTVTQAGRVLGTPAYMSPEQARGKEIDHRTDIWSFGCIMFQMLTGHLPFEGETATDTLARIIEREPDWEALPQETPENIRVLLSRCLEKDPDHRLGNIADAAVEINDTISKSGSKVVSKSKPAKSRKIAMIIVTVTIGIILLVIALKLIPQNEIQFSQKEIRLVVLPFENLGPTDDEWFVDGMTDELTNRLSGILGLAVISRQSANQCRKEKMSTRQIARDLNVDYILDGTVECEKSTDPNSVVRIDLRLVDTSSDTQVWRQPFDCDRSQLFELQSQVVEQVAQHLDILLLEQDRTWSKYIPTNSAEAHNLVMQGKAAEAASVFNYQDAIPFYEKAIEHDPNYAKAYSELAWAHTHIYFFKDPSPERLLKAEVAARRAFALLPDHPSVRLVMARYYFQGRRDFDSALKHLEKARELHPNHTWMLYWTNCVQTAKGDFTAALGNIRKAFELNPLSGYFAWSLGNTFGYLRDYPEAEHYYELAIMRDPNVPNYYAQKAWLYLIWQGDLHKARAVMEDGLKKIDTMRHPNPRHFYRLMNMIDIWDGRYEDALARLSNVPEVSETSIWRAYNALQQAEIYGYLNNTELARQYYESARKFLENKVSEFSGVAEYRVAEYHSLLGLAYAGLGDKEKAVEHGKRGTDMLPLTMDALGGADRIKELAHIYIMIGDFDAAIDKLEFLLNIEGDLSRALLKIDPTWNPIRDHPRFRKLLGSDK